MRLNIDGVTPLPRMLLISEFLLQADFQVELDGAVFVAAGGRVSYEDGSVVVTCSTGEQYKHPIRDSYWICR
ncbi:hypothetical protein [Streptomyces aureus]|uniref:hypothetical protein n=1 Tax=Streptomyces aureus TaxID=193461 RepID=UPI0005691E99|nr:hypothetical protein [Streptomyces aureus]